jgi:hypothetical protein
MCTTCCGLVSHDEPAAQDHKAAYHVPVRPPRVRFLAPERRSKGPGLGTDTRGLGRQDHLASSEKANRFAGAGGTGTDDARRCSAGADCASTVRAGMGAGRTGYDAGPDG